MTAKPALIRQGDVTRILKGAKAAGFDMVITVANGEVRFATVEQTPKPAALSPLDEWRERDRERQRRAARAAAEKRT